MIYIKIREIEEGFFTDLHDLDNFSLAIIERFIETGFLTGYHRGYSLTIGVGFITFQFKGITVGEIEIENFIVRNISDILDEMKLSHFCFVFASGHQHCEGDEILYLNHFKPNETKNSLLLKNILSIDNVPDHYRCKLSTEIMDEPVYTTRRPDILYNKKHLTYWLYSQSNSLDPFTKQTIHPIRDVIVDTEKKKEIDTFVNKTLSEGLLQKQKKFREVVQKLTGKENITQANIDQAFRTAAAKNEVNDLQILYYKVSTIDAQDNNPKRKRTALHWAVEKQSVDCVKWLLNKKASINIPDFENKTALDYASRSNNDDIKILLTGQIAESLQILRM